MSKSVHCITKTKENKKEITVLEKEDKIKSSKRINIVSIKMVRESSILYGIRKISSPREAMELGRLFLEDADREQLVVCCLDTKNQPLSMSIVSVGSLNSSIVHPREIFKVAILSNAASLLLFHNHPSGDPTPSNEDVNVTNRVKEAGKVIGIDLIDHIIIGFNEYASLREKGLL